MSGTITDNPLTSGAGTFNSAALASFPAVVAPGYAAITLDPGTANEEIVWIMAHTASATSATIWRAREGSAAVSHLSGSAWVHGVTALDLPASGQSAFTFSPPNWDDCLIQALYNVGSTPALISVFGDSISAGFGSTDFMNKGWVDRLRVAIAAKYTIGGDFYDTKLSQNYLTFVGAGSWSGTPPWVLNATGGTATVNWSGNLYQRAPFWTAAGGTVVGTNFVTPRACTQIDVVYLDVGVGTWSYNVDGGGTVVVTCTNTLRQRKLSITGLSNATHTLNITAQSADSQFQPAGAACIYAPTSGVHMARLAYTGATGGDWNRVDSTPADKISQLAGTNPAAFGLPTQPHLAVIELGANDSNSFGDAFNNTDFVRALGPVAYNNFLRRMVQSLRASRSSQAGYACSIVFLVPNFPDGVNSDVASNGTLPNAANWSFWVDCIYAIANDYNCAVVNMQPAWGAFGVGLGYQTATNLHPTDNGHQNIADLVATLIP